MHDFRNVTLRHDGAGIVEHQGFQNRTYIGIVRTQAENTHAAHAIQRFYNDVAMFGQKFTHLRVTGGHQSRRGELAEIQNRQFFIKVAHRLPAV